MKIKLFIAVVAALIVTTSGSFAQQRDCDQLSKERTERLKKEVGLDEKQTKSALEIYTKNCKESQKARQDSGGREAFAAMREKTNKEINALLTPQQQAKWKKAQEKAAAERGQGRGGQR